MDFLSIIIFIGIAAISINRSKNQGQNPRNRQRPFNDVERTTMQDTMNRPATDPAGTKKPQQRSRSFGSSSLEDMFREMQSDIRGVFGELKNSNAPKPPTKAAPVVEQQEAEDQAEQQEADSWNGSSYSSDYGDEYVDYDKATSVEDDGNKTIGQKGKEKSVVIYEERQFSLNLSKKSLVQAIIMKEILDKPKALRR